MGTTTDAIAGAVTQRNDSKAAQTSSEAGIQDANSHNITGSVVLAGSHPTAGAGPAKSDEKQLAEEGPVAVQGNGGTSVVACFCVLPFQLMKPK